MSTLDSAIVQGFNHVLELADRLPCGAAEDQVRRAIRDVIAADTGPGRRLYVQRLVSSIVTLQLARTLGRRRLHLAGVAEIERLLEALQQEVLPLLHRPG